MSSVSKGVKKIPWNSKHLPFIAHGSPFLKYGPSPKIIQTGAHYSTVSCAIAQLKNGNESFYVKSCCSTTIRTVARWPGNNTTYLPLLPTSKPDLSPKSSELP